MTPAIQPAVAKAQRIVINNESWSWYVKVWLTLIARKTAEAMAASMKRTRNNRDFLSIYT